MVVLWSLEHCDVVLYHYYLFLVNQNTTTMF